jgi:copper oxidase (laccase) domain-containing protein
MRSLGAIDVHAVIGPSICGHCYEVPFEMQQDVIADHPRAFSTTHKGTPGLNLPAALTADLLSEGVTFEASAICTLENDLYFSHRRENPTGRFAGVVSL